MNVKPVIKAHQSCSLTLQTTVSRKRLEKFLGGDDLESDMVRHDPSFSTFTPAIYTCFARGLVQV